MGMKEDTGCMGKVERVVESIKEKHLLLSGFTYGSRNVKYMSQTHGRKEMADDN